MQNIINMNGIIAQFGHDNKEALLVGKQSYQPVTIQQMVEDVVKALNEAKAELEAFDSFDRPIKNAQFETRMLNRVRNGIEFTVGYGSKNEALAPARLFKVSEVDQALEMISLLIENAPNGIFDDALNEKLASYRDRAEKGKAARRAMQNAQLAMAAE
jgi:hypothetical protein